MWMIVADAACKKVHKLSHLIPLVWNMEKSRCMEYVLSDPESQHD